MLPSFLFSARSILCLWIGAALALVACGGASPISLPRPQKTPAALPRVPDLELRGLLLLIADRQLYEPLAIERSFEGDALLRHQLAVTLGRLRNRSAVPTLQALLLDDAVPVRRAAAFSLAQLGVDTPRPQLMRVAIGEDREAATLAVAALAASGVSVLDVGEALAELGEAEVWWRLLPSLYRFSGEARSALARLALAGVPDPGLRAWAAYALAWQPEPESAPELRTLLADPDPWLRGLAARGLGRVGERGDLELLLPLLAESAEGPVIHALEAGRRLVGSARSAAAESWREPLARLLVDPRPGVRAAAIETSAFWLLDEELDGPLLAASASPGWAGDLALVALARAGHPQALDLAQHAASASSPNRRAAAASAAAWLGAENLLRDLASDPAPRVRLAALEGRFDALSRQGWDDASLDLAAELARAALSDPDPALQASLFDRLVELPLVSVGELQPALMRASRLVETKLSGVRALMARMETAESELPEGIDLLEKLALDRRWLVRRQAALALARLGHRPPPPGSVETGRNAAAYQGIVQRTGAPQRVEIVTSRGRLELELDCPAAPLTCLSFMQLAEQGFFDGQSFHRVTPGFAIQGGDPRGDGWGGPGYRLRDEVNRRRFVRGTLGMALSAPDTAGSQFFITLAPQPHLDGIYTALGHVVAGEELLDRFEPGDRIETIRPIA